MVLHRRRRPFRIFGRDGLEDLAVGLEGGFFGSWRAKRNCSLTGQPLDQGVVNGDRFWVIRANT